MSTPPLMEKSDLFIWIARRLGAPIFAVELSECHYQDALDSAYRWFTAKKGYKKTKRVPLLAGVNEYDIPDDVLEIIDVTFPSGKYDQLYGNFIPYILPENTLPIGSLYAYPYVTGGTYSLLVQNMQYREMALRITGNEPDWRQYDRKLTVYPVPGTGYGDSNTVVGEMEWLYKTNIFALNQLTERDHDLIKRYCLAFAKRDLGTIRTRYGNLPGANGQPVIQNGSQLLQEAEVEFQKLESEIQLSGFPMGFITG